MKSKYSLLLIFYLFVFHSQIIPRMKIQGLKVEFEKIQF
jgi:hypothetical protein